MNRSSDGLSRTLAFVSVLAFAGPALLDGQATRVDWELDPETSLVWWQVDPHFNHLWATTCPADLSWQAGEGRSPEYRYESDPGLPDAGVRSDKIPLYPRGEVAPLCRQAVHGRVTARDTVMWQDVSGSVAVLADSLVTGYNMRDYYARRWLLETRKFAEIRFRLDSLSGVQPGDTLHATAHGSFEVRGIPSPVAVPVLAWKEPQGLRVVGQISFPATDLVHRYRMSRFKLGMGVVMREWKEVHWGFDLLLR